MLMNIPADESSNKRSRNGIHGRQDTMINQSPKSKNFFRKLLSSPCGESPTVISYVTIAFGGLLLWTLLFAILGEEVEPGGQLFILIVLMLLSCLSGWLISLLHLPPLLGMLLCGIVLRNTGFFDVGGVYLEIISVIRKVALATILLKAGLGLNASALKKLSFVVARLAVLPCISETIGAAFGAHFFLNMPWLWAFLLGSILSAVSPAVVVPTLQNLQAQGFGETKSIATLVIAASSVDDIISISMFGVILGMIFSQGNFVQNILHGPVEAGFGLVIGISGGIIAACFPHRNENYLVAKRTFIVGGGGVAAILLSSRCGYSGSGPLATIILSFIAQLCWKWQGWVTYNPVADVFHNIWSIMQPLLFGLIGTEIKLNLIKMELIGLGFVVLLFSLFIRFLSCSVALIGSKLNLKEVIFVNFAWLPKATVQATLGPIALDMAIRYKLPDVESYARDVLTIAALSILFTAPVGAIGIAVGGPLLLSRDITVGK